MENTKTPRRRPPISPEDVFLTDIKRLITNLLIKNPNYENYHYLQYEHGVYFNVAELIKDTKDRAEFILERIEQIEHLVKWDDNDK